MPLPLNNKGLVTGLLGYELRKEFWGEAINYREVELYNFEIFSLDATGNPSGVIQLIKNDFATRYSGDIGVKAFQVPGEYTFPNDSVRAAKYSVQLEVKKPITGLSGLHTELASSYYKGLDSTFLNNYASLLVDFKEDFTFQESENGNHDYTHSLSFALQSGNSKAKAVEIASGLFAVDKDTTFGITTFVNGLGTVANTGTHLNYYTETYDLLRNTYAFSKKREVLPVSTSPYYYNLNHTLDVREDGIFNVEEKGEVQGRLTFNESFAGANTLIDSAYTRCNAVFNTYKNFAGGMAIVAGLTNYPVKVVKNLIKPSTSTNYSVEFTNDPKFNAFGITRDITIELDADPQNIVDIKHRYNYISNKRNPSADTIEQLMSDDLSDSQSYIPNYYQTSNFYNPPRPLNLIKFNATYPSYKTKATMGLDYSNNPRYFIVINGKSYAVLDYTVSDTKPVDTINEYKVINRPDKTSVLNYGYQTEAGQVTVSIKAGLGKLSELLGPSFRLYGNELRDLYRFGSELFINKFNNINPFSFNYFLSDARYVMDSDGVLTFTLVYTYTLKKHNI